MSARRFPQSIFFSAAATFRSLSLLDSVSTGNGIDDMTRLPLAAGVPVVSETEPTKVNAMPLNNCAAEIIYPKLCMCKSAANYTNEMQHLSITKNATLCHKHAPDCGALNCPTTVTVTSITTICTPLQSSVIRYLSGSMAQFPTTIITTSFGTFDIDIL